MKTFQSCLSYLSVKFIIMKSGAPVVLNFFFSRRIENSIGKILNFLIF